MLPVLVLLACCCFSFPLARCQLLAPERRSSDEEQEAESLASSLVLGDVDVLQGAFIGDVELVTKGLQAGGLVNPLMSKLVGERTLGFGKVGLDFPAAPALHLSFFCGRKENLNAAHYLIRKGASVFQYQTSPEPPQGRSAGSSGSGPRGYPIAVAYALGLGAAPTNEHAAFLQRTRATFPHLFESEESLRLVETWRNDSGNPPLLHLPILRQGGVFFDVVYTLVRDFKMNVDEADAWGVTPLHLAAWLGDVPLLRFLLFNNAKVGATDNYGRTPVHYAALRGHSDSILYLLNLFDRAEMTGAAASNGVDHRHRNLLTMKDKSARTPLQLAELTPLQNYSSDVLRYAMTVYDLPVPRPAAASAAATRTKSVYTNQVGDSADRRGGWYFPDGVEKAASAAAHVAQIDSVLGRGFKKGVFKRDYFYPQRPLLLIDLCAGQAIWAYWQREEFVHRYGAAVVEFGERRHSGDPNPWSLPRPSVLPLRAWVREYMGAVSECHLFDGEALGSNRKTCRVMESLLEDTAASVRKHTEWPAQAAAAALECPGLARDLKRPVIFDICLPERPAVEITLGPAGSSTPPHSHNASSWSLLLAGIKVWYFISPGDAGSALSIAASTRSSGVQGAAAHRVQRVGEWEAEVLPLLRRGGIVVSHTVQRAGDVVFVPSGYLHATRNPADTVSLTQRICAHDHTTERVSPLGASLYGGDPHRGTGEPNRLVLNDKFARQRQRDRERELHSQDGVPRFQ